MIEHPFILLFGWFSHLLAFVLVTLHCLRRRRNPAATILWIFTAWSFPVIGPLLYLGFGIDRVSDRGYLKFLADKQLLETRKTTQETAPRAYWHHQIEISSETRAQNEIDRVLDSLIADHPPLAGNRVVPLINGDEAYPEMLDAIRNARRHIHLQSFIIGNDPISREFMDALRRKAEEGVNVRLLYDRFGSTRALLGGLFRKNRGIPGFQIAGWTQANPMKRQFQINLRNHRKLLVVDGQTGFFGGVNIQNVNITRPGKKPIRDYHFKAEGPIVQELQYSFLRDWYFITEEDPQTLLTEDYFPHMDPAGDVVARLINSGPSKEQNVAVETFFNSIILARKQILAVTPYFVPPADILRALRSAALRGVDVRLVLPSENNHRYVRYAGRALYEELLLAGVRIYEREPPFMHAKAMIIDDVCALIGTVNLDERSLNLNYETTVAVYSETFADSMKQIVYEDIHSSREIKLEEWRRRPSGQKLFENIAVLMSPVL